MADQPGRKKGFLRAWGCAVLMLLAAPVAPAATGLTAWFDGELTPWLAERLVTHPRFKGEPLRVTVFDGDEEAARPDLLSYGLAARLEETLARTGGLPLAWSPSAPGADGLLPSGRPDCRPPHERYLIVVDSARTGQYRARVRVRALDLDGRSWVPGATRVWQGRLSPAESQQLDGSVQRHEFRGTRTMPFGREEHDLLAGAAARRIACRLLAHPAQLPRLWNEPAAADLAALPGLVSLQLIRYGVVAPATAREEADLVLSVESLPARSGTRQIWVAVLPGGKDRDVASTSVSLYAQAAEPDPAADPPASAHPRTAALDVVDLSDGDELRVRVSGKGLDRVAVLAMWPDGSLTLADSEQCGPPDADAAEGVLLRTHRDDGIPTVFAVGAAGREASRALVRELSRVPAQCAGPGLRGADLRAWLTDFERRLGVFTDRIVWRSMRPGSGGRGLAMAGRH